MKQIQFQGLDMPLLCTYDSTCICIQISYEGYTNKFCCHKYHWCTGIEKNENKNSSLESTETSITVASGKQCLEYFSKDP